MTAISIVPTDILAAFASAVERSYAHTGIRPTHAFLHHDDYELLLGSFCGQVGRFEGPISVYGVQVEITSAVKRGKVLLAVESDLGTPDRC